MPNEPQPSRKRRPVKRERSENLEDEPARKPRRRRAPEAAEEALEEAAPEFRPEELEGAERTKDGLIRVREDADATGKRKTASTRKRKPGKGQGAAADDDDDAETSWVKSLGIADYIGLAASFAILLGLAGMLLSWMYGEDWGEGLDLPDPVPETPVAGNLFKVTSIESYWRPRTDDDRAPSSEVIIPEVVIKVEPAGSQGFLSVLFMDASGTMSADSGNLTLSGGSITVRENEGRQTAPNTFTFTSTKGFQSEPEFRTYLSMEHDEDWTIEIVETTEFGSSDSKRLAYFEIARKAFKEDKGGE